jgi:hypothetical protein
MSPGAPWPVSNEVLDRTAVDQDRICQSGNSVALRLARAAARERAWALAGDDAPAVDGGAVTADIDATIVIAHSDKEKAAGTFKQTYGFHPLAVFADHGAAGTGEPLAIMLRPGNAGSNTAADHMEAMRLALAQLPAARRNVLVRSDSGGGTREFLSWLRGRRLQYSVGMTSAAAGIEDAVRRVPARAWTPAYDSDGTQRDGARVTELTGLLDLAGWPPGMRVIARKERPHPGAQLRLTDIDGHRITCFATSTRRGQLADLELRHRRRACCEDRIRCAKDTGLRSLPLHGFAQNQVWCELAALASELTAWMQMLALTGPARRWEPKKLRFRLLTTAGRIVRGSRRLRLRLDAQWPWAADIATAFARLAARHPGWTPAPAAPPRRKETPGTAGPRTAGATAGRASCHQASKQPPDDQSGSRTKTTKDAG